MELYRKYLLPLTFVVVGFIILASLAGGAQVWAGPNAQTSVTKAGTEPGVGPATSCCLVGPDGGFCTSPAPFDLTVGVPANDVPLGTLVCIAVPTVTPAPTGSFQFLGHAYDVTVTGPDGKAITTFKTPLDFFFTYTAQDLAKVNNNTALFSVQYYNQPTLQWTDKDLTNKSVDTTKTQVHVSVPHLTLFGLFGSKGSAGGGGLDAWFAGLTEWVQHLGPSGN